jgi:hypothetical protein
MSVVNHKNTPWEVKYLAEVTYRVTPNLGAPRHIRQYNVLYNVEAADEETAYNKIKTHVENQSEEGGNTYKLESVRFAINLK